MYRLALLALLLLPSLALAGPHVPADLVSAVPAETRSTWSVEEGLLAALDTQIAAATASADAARQSLPELEKQASMEQQDVKAAQQAQDETRDAGKQQIVIQKDELEQAKKAVDPAKFALDNANQRVDEARIGLKAAKVDLDGAKLALKHAKASKGDKHGARQVLVGKKAAAVEAKRTLLEAQSQASAAGDSVKAAKANVGDQKSAMSEARRSADEAKEEASLQVDQQEQERAAARLALEQATAMTQAQSDLDVLRARRDVLDAQIQLRVAQAVLVQKPGALPLDDYQSALSAAQAKLASLSP